MAYRVSLSSEVAAQVARFGAPESYYWRRALQEISDGPFCRKGGITERAVATAPFPLRTHSYRITCHQYVSGETVYLFIAEFLPGRTIAYVLDEWDPPVEGYQGEARIIFLRTH